ncbi:hypothetical protein CO726_13145 [Bacillus fungorum]|uniref:DUF3955 domain-containing protein n=1 Tax=Bacillus fungorum TaxID=2039284 RepID=A0A2G6QF17_9BACI|nr:hypothetical protein CO726_13145 [Bacillus fungorum]
MKQNSKILYCFILIFIIQTLIVGNMTFFEVEKLSIKKLILFTFCVLGLVISIIILLYRKFKKCK